MKKVYEASTPGFSRVMSNVASLFSSRTMSALPAVATLLCLSFVGTNIAYAQPCAGVSCDISFANLPTPMPPVGMPAEITFCLNSQGTGQITPQLMGGYTSSSNGTCCTIVRVWENAAATNPLTPADADYDVDCTDIGRTINVWVTRETNVPPIQGGPGRSAPLPFAIYIADCTPPSIVCPAPQTLLCLDDYTNSLPPNPMTYDDFNNLGGGASVTDNADDCGPTGFEVSYSDAFSNLVCLNGFTVTRTYVAKDATGWTASCTQVITVSDNQPPFFTNLPQDLTLNCPRINAGAIQYGLDVLAIQLAIQNWLNNYGGGTVDDSCPGGFTQNVVLCLLGQGLIGCQTTSPATGIGVWNQMPEACSPQPREVQVGFFVTDACGNEAFAVAKVILVDNVPPTITALPGGNAFSVTCENLVPAPNPLAVVANDNCTGTTPPPAATYAQLIREWVSDVPSPVASPTCGNRTIVRTYRVTDCAGNSATRSQTITVNDNVLPVWGPNPSALLLSCDDPDLEDKIDTWLADNGGADATDNCNGVTISADYASGAAVLVAMAAWCPGNTPTRSVNVTFSLVDGCGNAAANRVVAVTLYDYSAPTADPIPNATAQCNPSEVPNATLTGVTDNCTASADVTVTPQPEILISAGNGCAASPRVYVRNYRLTDCAGNTRDIPQIIVVADTQAPNWTVDPSPLTLTSCPPSNTDIQNWLDSEGTTGMATDNCGTVNFRTIPATVAEIRALLGPCAPFAGSVTVTFVAEDLCGNSSTKTAVLTVEDNVNPSAGNPATISVKCISEIPAPNIAVVPGVSDACSPAGTITVKYERDSTFGNLPGCPGNVYQFFHIYSIQDCSGNWIERAQRFNVSDDVEPNANCKAVTVSLDANGTVEVCAEQFDDNSADNCAGDLTYEFSRDIINDGINFAYGPYTECKDFTCADIDNIATCAANTNNAAQIAVRIRVIDVCGNVSGYCTTNLTVVDDIDPTITCPDDREVPLSDEGDYDCQTAVEIEHPTPADNCSVLCYEMEVQKEIDGVFVTIDPATGAPAPNYRQPVVAGDIATYTFEKGPFCGVNANDEVRRDDEYIIIYYIRDEHGNSNTCQYKITIVDDLAPVFTLCPSQPIIEAQATAGDCYQFKCWEPPTWYDNCQFPYFGEGSGYCPIPTLVVTTSDPSVMVDTIGDDHCALFPVGETQVYYTVTDFCGNSATCTVTVIISDIEDPMAMCVPVKTVNLLPLYPGPGFTTLTYADIDAGSTDNCGLCDKEVGRVYTPGGPILYGPQVYLDCNDVANSPITVYLRVKDCGQPIQNESVCETQVTVLDYQQPTIASCPADIVQCTDIDACNAVVTYNIPTFNDGCNRQHNGTLQSGLASGETFPIGETLVVYDYTSPDNGFNVICQFNVTIEDCQAPNMVCPPDVTLTCLEPLCCPEDFTGGTLTDNCGVTLLQSSDFDNNLSHCTYDGVHVVVRTYTAWDAAGNTSTCQRTYTWTEDTELPVLVQKPGDLSFECAADVPAPPVQSATDNCGTVNIDFVEVVQNNLCVNQTVIIRTWTATDLCGNTTQHVQTITVNDDDVPTFTDTPDNLTFDCSEDVPAIDNPTIDDNCDIFTVDFAETTDPGGCEDRFVISRTWTATDLCGNTNTFTQTITIYDGAAPSITNVADDYDGQCATEVPAVVAPTISDNCEQFTVDFSETLTPRGCEDNFILTRRWLATDACGNQTVAFQIITINDTTDPELIDTPNATETVECASDVPAVANVTATDNCGEPLTVDFSEVQIPGACVNQYQLVRTWTAEDDCGNSTSFVQTITVNDDVAPTFSNKPADYSADCSEDVQPVVAPDVDDNCDVYTVDFSETTAPGGCEDNFVITRTWVATDICGNASTYVQTVTIEDDIAPVFSNVPAGESHDCSQDVPAVVHPDVLDNCSQVVVDFSETIAPGGCEDKFTVTRTWVATDACGNQAMTQQVISIFDNIAPVLGNLPDPLVIEDCAQDVPLPALVTASDNCGQLLDVELTEINIPGTCHDRFSVLRRWTAQDACGNITAFVQLITIIDNQAPVLTNTPAPLVNVECAESVPAMPFPPVGATDNCGAPIDVEFAEIEIPGICANQYSIIRRWTAEDACGNISTFVQRININDTEAPELTNLPAALVEVDCADEVPAMPNPPVGATDNCGAPVDVEFSEVEIPGNCPNQYSITRTWTAEDVCGNTTVFVQTINIFDDEAPVLTVTPVDRTYECYDEVPAAPIDQQAIDNCDIAFIDFSESVEGGTNQDPNWSCPNNVTITRRWVATDLCGNTVEHIQEIRVHDEIPPSWIDFDPKDRHYDCLDDVLPAPDQQTLAADNCEVVVVDFLETRADDSCQNQVTIIRRWEATDLCGNKSTRWQYLYVRDTIAPVFPTTPVDRNYDCVEDVETAPLNPATDNCQVVNVDFAEFTNPGDCPSQVVINRRWVATDLCGNTAEHWQTITVNDDEAPVLSSTPFDVNVDCSQDVPAAPVVTATDNCDDVLVEFSETTAPGGCENQYVITRHWQAADLCGNSVEWYQTITVNDDEAPVVTAPAGLTLDCGDINETLDPSASVANWLASATATDNCDQTVDITYDFNATDLNVCVGGTLTVTWTATDACGNVGTSASTITIVPDTEDPIVTAPAAITLDCGDINETLDPSATISNWLASATATDNCDTDPELTYSFDATALNVCVGGTLTVTWTATDACGNVGTSASTITVVPDTEDPIVTAPAAITLDCGDISETTDPGATISNWLASATATDNCDTDPELTYDFDATTLDVCVGGTLTVTWTATDACGNVGTSASTITVVPDTEKPAITVPAPLVLDCGDISETADPAAQIAAWLATASATDNCDTDPELNHSFSMSELNICAPQTYTITVTWTANDACNNSTQKTQTITVIPDTEKPAITVPAPLVLDCGDISETADPAAQIAAWLATASASDNCDTDPELNHSFDISELNICAPQTYTITVTWTANDACNNSTQKTQTITVIPDTEKPAITVPAPLVLDCG
ncbi:MAG: HYR domain-containing protein, partial [Saprospiraceae bacterium]|nr:HYR domain-containing protein [Saprospiraceae bacterium]